MKRIIPIKNTVLCELVDQEEEQSTIISTQKKIKEYKILDFSSDEPFPFEKGDIILTAYEGDELDCEGKTLYLFNINHVMGKII